jgi:hypothetical protein
MLLEALKANAIQRGFLNSADIIDLEKAFLLVRDMPYTRASSRDPETIIREWRGTCSGKHYLLKGLFAELGYTSRLIACTTVTHIDPKTVQGKLRKLLEQSKGQFVDVHNYLVLELPEKDMIVDATWPLATRGMGTVVNERFVPGVDHQIACKPLHTWVVPDERNAQEFKDEILNASFTAEQIAHREEFIETLGVMTNNRWIRLLAWLKRWLIGPSDNQ